ncbi:hypothetical protein MVEN_00043800 [Mycena venus]|uniref:Uncharacterized protein n=1 Tax=Mycena venus TaxID=2733690 RepID=A0A8H6Z6P6_9AGAR|nr:hypothetical protein MVEN_00043800 [Mycena venus]
MLYLKFMEECNIQGINSLEAVVVWLNPPQEATSESGTILTRPVLEDHGVSVQWQAEMPQLRTLTAYVCFGPRVEDNAFLGLPVHKDNPLSLIWKQAETRNMGPFCVYKMSAAEKISATVIFQRSRKSPEHLVNMRQDHRKWAIELLRHLPRCHGREEDSEKEQ